ncbi:hypothetical protein chiPu_0031565, partial [Chiloscyllium punctatum]|nr:hypothetical protein [Chiloscyllium punctatum]
EIQRPELYTVTPSAIPVRSQCDPSVPQRDPSAIPVRSQCDPSAYLNCQCGVDNPPEGSIVLEMPENPLDGELCRHKQFVAEGLVQGGGARQAAQSEDGVTVGL